MVRRTYLQSLGVTTLSMLIGMIGGLVDGVVIGRFLDSCAIASYGIVLPILVLYAGFANILSSGAQALSSKALGRGDAKEAQGYFSSVMVSCLALGILLWIGTTVFSRPICVFLGAEGGDGSLMQGAADYLIGYAPTAPVLLIAQTLSSYMLLENDKKLPLLAAIACTVTDVIGDLLNVFLFRGGLMGMGLASAVSYLAMALVLLTHFTGKKNMLKLTPRGFRPKAVKDIIVLGLPSADIQFCSTFRTTIINLLLLTVGTQAAVSAFSVRMSMYNLYGSLILGFGMTTLLVSSFYIGEENTRSLKTVLGCAMGYGAAAACAVCLVVCLLAYPLVSMFTADPQVAALAVDSARFFALGLPFMVINGILAKYYQSLGQHLLSHVISILENLVYVCLLALALSRLMSVTGIWIAFLLSEVMTLATIFLFAWVKVGRCPRSIEDIMLLPKGFGADENMQFDAQCSRLEDCAPIVREMNVFLTEHGAGKKTASHLCLCAEELLVNIVRHGITNPDKQTASLRLLDKTDQWVLCICDNGAAFDPKKWIAMHHGEDGHTGLRLVAAMARDIGYVYTLKMNQIHIRVGKDTQ